MDVLVVDGVVNIQLRELVVLMLDIRSWLNNVKCDMSACSGLTLRRMATTGGVVTMQSLKQTTSDNSKPTVRH